MVSLSPVILCGGSGTRLWPLSTPKTPKQFLALTSDQPMIAETADRFRQVRHDSLQFGQISIVGSLKHQSLLEQIVPDARLILEPFGRNSAPAIAAACLVAQPDELTLILPADHRITDVPAFHAAIARAFPAALEGSILTFGLEPAYAATGYGYIQAAPGPAAVRDVMAFVEKPAQDVAEAYLADGNYFWNAGIFMFRASTMIMALQTYAPAILPAVRAALGSADGACIRLEAEAFAQSPDISIDYAVMEHADNVKVVPVEMGWSDVGDYQALHAVLATPDNDLVTRGPVLADKSERVYINAEGPAIAVSGLTDLTVVSTPDTVMIVPAGDSEAVKALGKKVQSGRYRLGLAPGFSDHLTHWLWQTLDYWTERVWDNQAGGFVEQLSLDGIPDTSAPRRVRVQARQLFSFARALQYGWPNREAAQQHVANGLTYLDEQLRHQDGGWVHIADAQGRPLDMKRDLYDHAFIILAGAAVYDACGERKGLDLAYEAAGFINTRLRDQEHGGWFESLPQTLPRRANPHMHLLEASSALYRATGRIEDMAIANECVALFESYFFNPRLDVLGELFGADWTAETEDPETVFEAGHMYEWASLLHEYDRLTGHDSLSWRRRLMRCADRYVRQAGTGFAMNAQRSDGVEVNSGRRLWPQLEMFRAHLLHPGLASHGMPERIFERIEKGYLNALPDSLWMDEFDADGKAVSRAVPASMLYHFLTAISPIL